MNSKIAPVSSILFVPWSILAGNIKGSPDWLTVVNRLCAPEEVPWGFVKIIADLFGINIEEGSELAELSRLLTTVDKLFDKDYDYASFSTDPEKMMNLPAGNSSMFSDIVVKTTAANVSKLLTNQEFSQMVFDGEAMPILESIVRNLSGSVVSFCSPSIFKGSVLSFT